MKTETYLISEENLKKKVLDFKNLSAEISIQREVKKRGLSAFYLVNITFTCKYSSEVLINIYFKSFLLPLISS